jgi:hypothetical protein
MAHLWMRDASTQDGWSPSALAGDARVLSAAALVRHAVEPEGWVLIGPRAVRVNGASLDAGIRVLRDRDEIVAGAGRIFFSSESLAAIVAFPAGAPPTFCARCKLAIAPGSPAVRCPQCVLWHHQSDELPCWTYAERCTMCDQPTALDAGFRWTPEEQ